MPKLRQWRHLTLVGVNIYSAIILLLFIVVKALVVSRIWICRSWWMCNSCWNATGFVILHTSLFILWSRTHAVMHMQGSEHSVKGYLISYHGSPEAQTLVAMLGHRCLDPAEPSAGSTGLCLTSGKSLPFRFNFGLSLFQHHFWNPWNCVWSIILWLLRPSLPYGWP